ncbi:MAG: hypothetical protein JRJ10_05830, partial [Deltaproteobacteria bacterium]|nr:hypothetical protein [Deltaproteobacteria bacterium]
LVGGALALLVSTSVASAQGAWSAEPSQTSPYSSNPVGQYPPPSSAEQQAYHRGYQGAFTLGVPVFLNVDKNVVRPGADLNFFGGYDIGYAVFGLALGAMWTPMNLYNIPGATVAYDRSPMTRLYLAPEFRVQVPNNTPILPYLGVTFDANWWRVKETEIVCGGIYYYYCARVAVFRFTPGMTVKLGMAFRVSTGSYIDVGVKYSLSGTGSFFFRREQWITPYLGILFR